MIVAFVMSQWEDGMIAYLWKIFPGSPDGPHKAALRRYAMAVGESGGTYNMYLDTYTSY